MPKAPTPRHRGTICAVCSKCEKCHPRSECVWTGFPPSWRVPKCYSAMSAANGPEWRMQENRTEQFQGAGRSHSGGSSHKTPKPEHSSSSSSKAPPKAKKEVKKTNHYELLGLQRTATVAQCVKAARKKLVSVHPDKHPEERNDAVKNKHWTDEAAKIIAALEVFGDAAKKAAYDGQV